MMKSVMSRLDNPIFKSFTNYQYRALEIAGECDKLLEAAGRICPCICAETTRAGVVAVGEESSIIIMLWIAEKKTRTSLLFAWGCPVAV